MHVATYSGGGARIKGKVRTWQIQENHMRAYIAVSRCNFLCSSEENARIDICVVLSVLVFDGNLLVSMMLPRHLRRSPKNMATEQIVLENLCSS